MRRWSADDVELVVELVVELIVEVSDETIDMDLGRKACLTLAPGAAASGR